MSTFTTTPDQIRAGLVTLTGADARHLINVLRVKIGENIYLSDGKGHLFEAVISNIKKGSVSLDKVSPRPSPPKPYPIHLFVALLKSEKLEFIVQKAVELNIQAVHLIKTDRSVATNISETKWKRLHRIADEAQKQCGRLLPLEIAKPLGFSESLSRTRADLSQSHVALICREHEVGGEKALPLKAKINASCLPSSYSLWIGPEGGWTKAETELAQKEGLTAISLAPLILRAETAAIHAISSLVTLAF